MDMVIIMILSITSFIGNLILAGVLIFSKSYLNKKGENLATKEDIEEITKKVENVKLSVDVLKQSQISYDALRRDAVINYYEQLSNVIYYLERADYDHAKIEDYDRVLDKMTLEMSFAIGKFDLFVEEFEELTPFKTPMFLVNHSLNVCIINYIHTLRKLKQYQNSSPDTIAKIQDDFTKFKMKQLEEVQTQLKNLKPHFRSIIRNQEIKTLNPKTI